MEERQPRKLAVILHADVVGSTALVRRDESLAHERIRDAFHRFSGTIESYNGHPLELRGDALLAEFSRASDAVEASLAFQAENTEFNSTLEDDIRPTLRIGISLGEVVVADNTITGEGIVLAQRLEQLASGGGVCVQGAVYEAVPGRLPFEYASLGEQELKGFSEPVRAYAVSLKSGEAMPPPEVPAMPGEAQPNRPRQRWIVVGAMALLVLVGGGLARFQPWAPREAPASVERMAFPLPDKPSIAVLPFTNMSGDPEQEYFVDGMTEDLTTDLSKISDLTVISRTSTSGYKGRKIDIRDVGEALNVRYVIEGSVRKAGSQVRISAQLIDATTGSHLWAERYDGSLNDIFSLQDQVLEKIVGSLALRLSENERERMAFRGTRSAAAHDLYLRGVFQESTFTREGSREAMRLYEQALSIDADYALPYARIANILELSARNGWSNDIQADLTEAVELTEKAVALDPQNPNLYWSLGRATARLKTPAALERGIEALQRAIELDPDFADAYAYLTMLYVADGRGEDGLRSVETAMRLNPRYPFWYLDMRGTTRYVLKNYESAIADFEAAVERNPTALFLRWMLAASYAQAGQMEDAEWQVEELLNLGFEGTLELIVETSPIQDPRYLSLYEEGLRKAGIPE
ncbi:MAG: tetratricopeptide repeat protein [Gemmatimonadetes bacterium]|nr:tetratricopeptide repeat protein [Gemmatimonadota bacterium]